MHFLPSHLNLILACDEFLTWFTVHKLFLQIVSAIAVTCYVQDAHEFLNYLLNELVDILEKEAQATKSDQEISPKIANGPTNVSPNGPQKEPLITWVHKNFQVSLVCHLSSCCCTSFWCVVKCDPLQLSPPLFCYFLLELEISSLASTSFPLGMVTQ